MTTRSAHPRAPHARGPCYSRYRAHPGCRCRHRHSSAQLRSRRAGRGSTAYQGPGRPEALRSATPGMDRLHHAAPSGAKFFAAAAQRGVHLGALTRGLTDLLDTHGAAALEAALTAALARTLCTSPPCATSSISIVLCAAHARRSRCICPMIRRARTQRPSAQPH